MSLPLSGKDLKDMIPLPVPIKQTAIIPSLPLPLEVFTNGPVPNQGFPKGGGGKQVMGRVQGGSPQHLAPQGPAKWRGGSPGDPPCPN